MNAPPLARARKPLVIFVCLAVVGASDARANPAITWSSSESAKTISVPAGRSRLVRAPWPVKRVSVTDPDVADVQALNPREVLVLGKARGSTDLFLWNASEDVRQARVDITPDLDHLADVLTEALPGASLDLRLSQDVVVVGGSLARAEQVQQLRAFLTAADLKYVDTTRLAGVHQVQIQVRVAEVSRTAIRALGVNALQTGSDAFGGLTIGPAAGGALNPINIGVPEGAAAGNGVPFVFNSDVNVSPFVTLFGGFPDANLEVFLQALAEDQYLRVLAEPNLIAMSGEEATFLAGGEFPIPVVQGSTSGSNSISIEYKEFGVRLRFQPTVLGDSKIRLHVAPEVSELTDTGAVEIEGFRIPAVMTRRASTTMELNSGQTFAMAGLLSSRKEARSSRVPLLGDIPVLGALFRSVRYSRGQTELVVLVTASLVEPLSLASVPPLPGTSEVQEEDWKIFLSGRVAGRAARGSSAGDPPALEALGLERLRGPGAWVSHEDRVIAKPSIRPAATEANE